MSKRNALIGAALVIVAVVALIVLSGGEDESGDTLETGSITNTTTTGEKPAGRKQDAKAGGKAPQADAGVQTIVIGNDGKPVGGVAELSVEKGEQVRFKVESAVADHVHVHGYDLMQDVEPGIVASFDFPASLEGIFEAELEDRVEPILELRVEP